MYKTISQAFACMYIRNRTSKTVAVSHVQTKTCSNFSTNMDKVKIQKVALIAL